MSRFRSPLQESAWARRGLILVALLYVGVLLLFPLFTVFQGAFSAGLEMWRE